MQNNEQNNEQNNDNNIDVVIINEPQIYDINAIPAEKTMEFMDEGGYRWAHMIEPRYDEDDEDKVWIFQLSKRIQGPGWMITVMDQSMSFPDLDHDNRMHLRYQRNAWFAQQGQEDHKITGIQEAIVDTETHEILENKVTHGEIEIDITPVLAEIDYKTYWCWDAVIPPVPGVFTDAPVAGYGKGKIWFNRQNDEDE